MSSKETAVRDAAKKLQESIAAAEAEGYRVQWPVNAAGLGAIAISETAKMKPAAPAAAAAKPAEGSGGKK